MRVSSPSSSSARASALHDISPTRATRLFVAIGTAALLTAIVILIAGGFVIDLGPLHLSLRRWPRPAGIALVAWLVATRRSDITPTLAVLTASVERHALSIAIVLAASAAACGIAFGTYAASGSDAAGYIGEAQLFASGRTGWDEPLARVLTWPNATASVAPLGFRPGTTPGRLVPTYPPGLPLTMVAARGLSGEIGPFLVSPLLGAVAVLATYVLGRRMYSPVAGLVAAALLATSPILLFQIAQPMSDVAVTGWWALALVLAWNPSTMRAAVAGLVAGIALLTRPNLLPLLFPLAVTTASSTTRQLRVPDVVRLGALLAGLAPSAAALALLQWRMYGSPLASGYGASAFRDFFSLSNIPQNVADYTGRILIGERPALAIATVACVALVAVRRQRAAVPPATTAVVLAAFFAATVVLCYLPYGVFPDWWYLRFLLPAFPALFALIGIAADLALTRVTLPARGILLLVALTTACSFNIVEARRQQAFILRTGEARYDLAGRYLESTLPRNAVIVTSQESASAHVYTHLPIVRWDLLPIDLDAAVAQLTALGRRPLLLIEDWERRDLVARFPASALARLDWTPLADFGDPVRVGLFDPSQRGQTVVTDRVH